MIELGNPTQPTPEFPSPGQLRAYGDMSFLYLRARAFQNMPVSLLRRILQPPIDLGFLQVFRFEDVPRCAITWAFLSPEVELKLISGQVLEPKDWLSGNQMWMLHLVAPYGGTSVRDTARWLKDNIPEDVPSVRYIRVDSEGILERIVEISRKNDGKLAVNLLKTADLSVAH